MKDTTEQGSPKFVPPEERIAAREQVGTFSDMAEARKNGWIVVSMKNDWRRIFAFDDK